jgi:hypothetical protein
MRFRKLRIAWSVVWGLAAVLLIILWVRSYKNYIVTYNGPTFGSVILGVDSKHGVLTIGLEEIEDNRPWSVRRIENSDLGDMALQYLPMWGIDRNAVRMPYWFATSLSLVLTTLPWFRQVQLHFSLRSLLIATTLVAVVLGAIVYAVR